MTQQSAVDWAVQQLGKSLNYDGKFGAQCWDLIMFYCKWLGQGMPPGVVGAAEWANKNWPSNYKKVSVNEAQPGDIGIWGATNTNKYGHAFIIVGVGNGTLDVVDQNYVGYNADNGSPAARHTVQINDRLTAVIRPSFEQHPAAGSEPGKYAIKANDTFWGLEQKNGWQTGTLQSLNPALDPRKLAVGQVINIPGGAVPTQTAPVAQPAPAQQRLHTVANGENLTVIAARYNVQNWRQIYDIPANRATIGGNPSLIKPGQVLVIP